MDDASLHMLQLWMDTRRLTELGRMLHLPLKQADTNYLVHCALGELFQDQAPGPFAVEETSGKQLRLLAYSEVEGDVLHEVARGFASPTVYEICDWDRLSSKPMPETFPEGMRLGFELRVCPVVRMASDGKYHSKGSEVDAFLAECWKVGDPDIPVDREEVYRDWFYEQLDRRGGAEAQRVTMESFKLERMLRRTHGRKTRTIKRPSVLLTGEMEVTEGEAFVELLGRGIGRHRSFGFGMLKVRRARR